MKYQMVPRLTSMLAVWMALLVWQLSARHTGDLGVLLFLLLLAIPLTMSGVEWASCRRDAFRRQCLTSQGWLDRLVGLAPPVLAMEVAKSAALALLLLTTAVSLDLGRWAVWLLHVLILAMLMPRLPGLLADTVTDAYLFSLSRRAAIWFSTLLLWLEAVVVLLLANGDDYRGLSWREALEYSVPEDVATAQGLVDVMLRLQAGADGMGAWAASVLRLDGNPVNDWVAFLVLTALVLLRLLVAYAYSRALVGALARPLAVWRTRSRAGKRADVQAFEAWWL